jgi:hypothetical protein
MHLSLDLVRPNGERVVYGGECQPRLRNRDYAGFIFWVGGSFRNLKKDKGAFSAIFHGIPCRPIQGHDSTNLDTWLVNLGHWPGMMTAPLG